MDRCPLPFRDERVGRLLDAVVEEGVGAFQAEDESRPNRLPERRVDLLLWFPVNQAQGSDLGDVPQTGESVLRLPASCSGRRFSFPAMRSTTLSV